MVQIFDKSNIDELPEMKNAFSKRAVRFVLPFIERGTETFIQNAKTELALCVIDDYAFPLTITRLEKENCYTCSLSHFYGGLSVSETARIKNPTLRYVLTPPAKLYQQALQKSKVDKMVIVNNWLLSTNLFPELTANQISQITKAITTKYPRFAVMFRSLTEAHTPTLYNTLALSGYRMIPCRPIFFIDGREEDHYKARMFKSDLKILNKTDYEIVPPENLKESDYERIAELYSLLFIGKYSDLSAHLTPDFFRLAIEEKLYDFLIVRKEGRIDAILGYYKEGDTMTGPLFGYDTTLPQNLGLYRIISALLSLKAQDQGCLLNMSGGASSYKSLRRGQRVIEYNAVYTKHLNILRRTPWKILDQFMNRFATPQMMKFEN